MPQNLDFFALKALRDRLAGLLSKHEASLEEYESEDGKGYCHQITDRSKASVASSATCVASLISAGKWKGEVAKRAPAIAKEFLSRRSSSGLDDDNPFSLAFMAEGILDLAGANGGYSGSVADREAIRADHATKLVAHLKSGPKTGERATRLNVSGAIAIPPYPPSAYLTQLVHRVLVRLNMVEDEMRRSIHQWSRAEINKQVALIVAKSRTADPLQLAYALILAVRTASDQQTSPEDKEIFAHALGVFFDQQLEDGSWPLSRPMFHYKEVGNAYCFDYELLTQLLLCAPLRDDLLRYLPELEKTVGLAVRTSYDLAPEVPGTKLAWASGHHPQLEGPESWSTASVYHFAHALDRVVAEGVRQSLFLELGLVYPGPPAGPNGVPPHQGIGDFAADFLDADLTLQDGSVVSLRETLARRFVFRIAREAEKVSSGGKLSKSTPMSAILFGPPGTSKTQLAKIISSYLGWPLVSVDPSYLVQEGLDRVQAMANRLFSMLGTVEQVVVLLDEFDEMGRTRAGNDNLLSRFITTAMLPKLAAINDERKIVFLLATNYVRGFDAAFSRGGRFDMRLQVMQPNVAAKLEHKPWKAVFDAALAGLASDDARVEAKLHIGRLTYLETVELVRQLEGLNVPAAIAEAIELADKNGTLSKENSDAPATDETAPSGASSEAPEAKAACVPNPGINHVQSWGETCTIDSKEIRLPSEC